MKEERKEEKKAKENVVSQLDVNLKGVGFGREEVGRETRVRRKRSRRRKKRTYCLEGEGERRDPKSGQDSQVSAIGKGNEANEHTPNGGFVQSKIKMWVAWCPPAHSNTLASLGGEFRITLKAEVDKRSYHVHPWLKSTMVPRHSKILSKH